jgi:transcriptional antiterminator RfaH
MPILEKETDLYPGDLFERFVGPDESVVLPGEAEEKWWALYTLSRHEKQLMRKLISINVAFYGPLVPKRYRSPAGRSRISHMPLFPGYVFIYGDNTKRYDALTTNCVSKWFEVPDQIELVEDLQRIKQLIATGHPLTPEARLVKGDPVRVKTGPFAGIDGVVIRRQNKTRLLVGVNFTQQGVSVVLEDCELEKR